MNIENELFTSECPSFESVLYWKDKRDRASDINKMIERFKIIFDNDREKFYEHNFEFFIRAVTLLSHYQNYEAFESVFYFYVEFSLDEEDNGLGPLENYLSKGVTLANQEFLLSQWQNLYDVYEFSDFVTIEPLELLLIAGYYSSEIEEILVNAIRNEDAGMISSLVIKLDKYQKAQHELAKKLKYIAPMIKYVGGSRFTNPYFADWIEFAEAYLKYFKNTSFDDRFEEMDYFREENDQFLIDCLGIYDNRVRKINNKYLTKEKEIEFAEKSARIVCAREELMKEEFLDKLPDTYQEWLNLPFINPAQREEMIGFVESFAVEQPSNKKSSNKVGRNDSCPCGSGKKHKKCCLV